MAQGTILEEQLGREITRRSLVLDDSVVASAYLEGGTDDAVLAWDTNPYGSLTDVLEDWFRRVYPAYSRRDRLRLEARIDDRYFHEEEAPADARSVLRLLRRDDETNPGIVLLSDEDVALEILFDRARERPARLALIFQRVHLGPVAEFLAAYSETTRLREDPRIFDSAVARQGLLSPLPFEE